MFSKLLNLDIKYCLQNFKARNILLPQQESSLNPKLCLSSAIEEVAFSVLNLMKESRKI